jgi:hypothetical protein
LSGFLQAYDTASSQVMEQLVSNTHRTIVRPSLSDIDTARTAFEAVIGEWEGKSQSNRKQLEIVRTEIAKLRAAF